MAKINPHILNTLKEYLDEHPDIPSEMGELVKRLLEIESTVRSYAETGGIDKLYDQLLEKFVDNQDFVVWCKNYVKR